MESNLQTAATSSGKNTLTALFRPLLPVSGGLRAYDLFALTVAIMIFGHVGEYFAIGNHWWRVPDRIVVPVFLVSVGYNAGSRLSRFLWGSAVLMTVFNWVLTRKFYIEVLAVIILSRLVIDPLARWALKSRVRFYAANLLFVALCPLINDYVEYGTLALTLAMAGWVNRNRSEIPAEILRPREFFIFTYLAYLACVEIIFRFSAPQFIVVAGGTAWVMYVLYNFRPLLLNSIQARPRDIIEKFCSFLGHKSLEIYVIHSIALQLLFFYAVTGH